MIRDPRPTVKTVKTGKEAPKGRFQVRRLEARIAPRQKFHDDQGNHYGQYK
jgi:hypothetical protein